MDIFSKENYVEIKTKNNVYTADNILISSDLNLLYVKNNKKSILYLIINYINEKYLIINFYWC